ncbi:aldo-keto reductase family 1 member B1-like [Oratosquilla oratoria]|uniref:aldo-keto reductase family 1 member B1-like n=1 Tax=Oratosquilla oratoria TaxID=337810 RepID=UPI003F761684
MKICARVLTRGRLNIAPLSSGCRRARMSQSVPNATLNTGYLMPMVGLGTWQSKPGEVTEAVKAAISCGYRHIDCALVYGNEPEVGEAIKTKINDGTVKREDLFITSKLWNTFHSKELVMPSLKTSLKNLGVDYVDLYLIHWPMGYKENTVIFPKDEDGNWLFSDVDFIETWKAIEECKAQGLCRSIGVSNFNKDQIERIIKEGSVVPAVVQVECHPYLNQRRLIDYCKSKGITVTAYSSLGTPARVWAKPEDPRLMEDPKIVAIAEKHAKTPAQVLLRYQLERGVIVIPKSVTKSRIESNFQVCDFELTKEDISNIDSLDSNCRFLHLTWVENHPHYPFHAEF